MRRISASVQTSSSYILTRPFRSPVPSPSNCPFLAMTHSKTSLPAPSTEQASEYSSTVTLDFKEEPIGIPPSEGLGFLDVNIGDKFGPDGC
jgi:hypothetical protein